MPLSVCRHRSDISSSVDTPSPAAGLDARDPDPATSQTASQAPSHQGRQAGAGRGPPSLASGASLARGGFLTIGDIWAGPAPRGHRHEKPGARRKHHLHIIRPRGGSQRLPPAAAGMPGKAKEDTTRPGRGRKGGRPGREGRAGPRFFPFAPDAPEANVAWFGSRSLLGTPVVPGVKKGTGYAYSRR